MMSFGLAGGHNATTHIHTWQNTDACRFHCNITSRFLLIGHAGAAFIQHTALRWPTMYYFISMDDDFTKG